MDLFDHLVARGWIKRLESEFTEKEKNDIRAKYHCPGVTKSFKPRTHIMLCSRAHSLAESVFVLGGTKKELHKVLEYLMICLDCEKYSLDCKKYRENNNIRELEKKYQVYP